MSPLSRRQRQVVVCASQGMGVKRTALRLGLSEHTVAIYRKQALRALGAEDMPEAVAILLTAPRRRRKAPPQGETLNLV